MESTTSTISTDPCLRPFLQFENNSSWIDSLFVAFFHRNEKIIKNFINKLKVKDGFEQINNEDEIIKEIKKLYNYISNDTNYDITSLKIRSLLNEHNNLLKKQKYYLTNKQTKNTEISIREDKFNDFISSSNDPIKLLQYLYFFILDKTCFDNIKVYKSEKNSFNDNGNTSGLKNAFEENYLIVDESSMNTINKLEDINFINFNLNNFHEIKLFENVNKDNNKFILYSIIANIKYIDNNDIVQNNYVCYYRCAGKWYLYDNKNSTGNNTTIIGNFDAVEEKYKEQIVDLIQKINEKKEKYSTNLTTTVNFYDSMKLDQIFFNINNISLVKYNNLSEKDKEQLLESWKKYNNDKIKEYNNELLNVFSFTLLYLKGDIILNLLSNINNQSQKEEKKSALQISSAPIPFANFFSLSAQQPKTNKIQKLKELIDEHFKRLNI